LRVLLTDLIDKRKFRNTLFISIIIIDDPEAGANLY